MGVASVVVMGLVVMVVDAAVVCSVGVASEVVGGASVVVGRASEVVGVASVVVGGAGSTVSSTCASMANVCGSSEALQVYVPWCSSVTDSSASELLVFPSCGRWLVSMTTPSSGVSARSRVLL